VRTVFLFFSPNHPSQVFFGNVDKLNDSFSLRPLLDWNLSLADAHPSTSILYLESPGTSSIGISRFKSGPPQSLCPGCASVCDDFPPLEFPLPPFDVPHSGPGNILPPPFATFCLFARSMTLMVSYEWAFWFIYQMPALPLFFFQSSTPAGPL